MSAAVAFAAVCQGPGCRVRVHPTVDLCGACRPPEPRPEPAPRARRAPKPSWKPVHCTVCGVRVRCRASRRQSNHYRARLCVACARARMFAGFCVSCLVRPRVRSIHCVVCALPSPKGAAVHAC